MEYYLEVQEREKGLLNKLRPLFGLEPKRKFLCGKVVELKNVVMPAVGQTLPIVLFKNLVKPIAYTIFRVDLQPIAYEDERSGRVSQEIAHYRPRVYVESSTDKDYYVPKP
jgi:hypothetical protein